MTLFYTLAAALCVLAAALLIRPLWWVRRRAQNLATAQVGALSLQLHQLKDLHSAGTLNDEHYEESRRLVERKLVAAVVGESEAESGSPAAPTPSRQMGAVLVVFVVAVTAGGYAWIGSPANVGVEPLGAEARAVRGSDGASAPEGTAHALTAQEVSAMIDRLAARLKAQPEDPEGWQMLARSYVAIGKHAQSVDAFRQAARLRPDDANLLADFADALAMTQGRKLDGEPSEWIERALKADPANPKALALAGTAAFNRRDFLTAVRYWEKVVEIGPTDGPYVQQVQGGIVEARQQAGLPAVSAAFGSAASAAPPSAARPSQVSGTVTVAPELKSRLAPDDTVFVFARAPGGSRMPLAILRKRVRDLPLQFMLDDSLSMSPDAKLSSVSRVIVGARISKSGNAMPQPGDLQGFAPEVAVGARDLRVEISEGVAR
jgi:cytochrome c-type biogenesis protein CcmH